MSYFSKLPNVFIGEGVTDNELFKYRLSKNLCRKVKSRPDLSKYVTLFEAHSIKDNETPASIAYELFQDSHLDWTILLINDITDFYEQWPRDLNTLSDYVNEKYTNPDDVHHYETNEILYNDIVFIKEGVQVTLDYRCTLPDGTTKTAEESRYPITNYEHEYAVNEQKRQILVPTGAVLDMMIEEFEDLVGYEPHSELDDQGNKKTPLSMASRFLNNIGSQNFQNTGLITNTGNNGGPITYDDGPTTVGSVGVSGTVTTTSTTTSNGGGSAVSSTSTSSTPSPTPSPSPSPSPSPQSGGSGGSGYGY